ncbi:MAG TPA: hypothetical protein P5081_15205 [Phycisphaerae bacterium]|nr:hypothetical protein [Phycisphaerae bacterium]HRW54218.1 hypothetical protein [Phycisphaerae bacterium]
MHNSKVKIGIAVGLLVVAAGIVWYSNSGEKLPDDVKRTTFWYCDKCDAGFELPDPPPEGALVESPVAQPNDDKPSAMRRVRKTVTLARCPTCGEQQAHAGLKCGGCGAAFRRFNENGDILICPKCKWDPTTNEKAAGDREFILDE